MMSPGSGAFSGSRLITAASVVVGAAFSPARNLSRSMSACFLLIALSPLLGAMIWNFRLVFTEPSGWISSCQ